MATEEVKQLKIETLHVATFHKRSLWGAMAELRDSILANGILEPLIVRPRARKDGGGYEIAAGVRRMKAATMAELKTVPCIVRDLDDEDMIALQVDENRQREGIHPLDESGYCEELSQRGMATEAIAKRLGLKKREVLRRMALLGLSKASRAAYVAGRFDHEAALELAQLRDAGRQKDVLAAVDAGTLSPDDISAYVRRTFTAQLDDVPWRKSDEKLVMAAGACTTCSKRSDVQRDLFPDAKAGLRCLDVDCYRSKMDAIWALERAKEGVQVLDQDPESLFLAKEGALPIVVRSSGMVDHQALCPIADGFIWADAVARALPPGAEAPQIYIARDQDGRPRYLMREAVVSRIVRKARPETSAAAPAGDASHAGHPAADAARAAAASSQRAENKLRRQLVHRLAERAVSDAAADTWTWVADRVIDGATARAVSAAADLLGESIKAIAAPEGKEGLVALAHESNRQARRVVTAVLVFDEADVVNEISTPLRQLAALLELDLAEVESSLRRPS